MERVTTALSMVKEILETNRKATLIRYEDMVDDYETFYATLSACVPLSPGTRQLVHDRTRIRENENPLAHRRSGRTGTFAEKLKPETVAVLNREMADLLEYFSYTR
jgi:hypothetical protein